MIKRFRAFPMYSMITNSLLISKKKLDLLLFFFFAEQCLLPKHDNEVPNNFPFLTEKYSQISKTHGRDMINIRMLKLCDLSLCKPLSIVLKSWFS